MFYWMYKVWIRSHSLSVFGNAEAAVLDPTPIEADAV